MYTNSREEEVKLFKRLWASQPTLCPRCGREELVPLHKKPKRAIAIGNAPDAAKYTGRSVC